MKKMFGMVLGFFFLYLLVQTAYNLFVGKHNTSYNIKVNNNIYYVTETFNNKYKTTNHQAYDKSSYYYEIKKDKASAPLFNFKLVGNYNGVSHFLENLEVYQNNDLICIYPIFKDPKISVDVMCRQADKQYMYTSIKGQNSKIEDFIDMLKKLGYSEYSWNNPNLDVKKLDKASIYINNLVDNHYVVVWNYKNIYVINKGKQNIVSLSIQDHYENNIATLMDRYYIIPSYVNKNDFNNLIRINLINLTTKSINLPAHLSYDSFIQGVVDNTMYIVDRNDKVQYQLNMQNNNFIITGDVTTSAKYYHNGKWENKSIYDIVDNNLMFGYDIKIPDALQKYNAYKIDSVNGDTDGYYYLYIKEGNMTNVYRVDKQNLKTMTLLFKINSLSSIKYVNNALYFLNGDTLYIYSDATGLRPLIKNNEFAFNHTNMYDIYIDQD